MSTAEVAEVSVPATLQATIAARIDRLRPESQTHVERSGGHRLAVQPGPADALGVEPAVDELVAAQFIDQVRFTRQPEYVFHHPLIRTVAYESQLKSDRAELHQRLAAAIEGETDQPTRTRR